MARIIPSFMERESQSKQLAGDPPDVRLLHDLAPARRRTSLGPWRRSGSGPVFPAVPIASVHMANRVDGRQRVQGHAPLSVGYRGRHPLKRADYRCLTAPLPRCGVGIPTMLAITACSGV